MAKSVDGCIPKVLGTLSSYGDLPRRGSGKRTYGTRSSWSVSLSTIVTSSHWSKVSGGTGITPFFQLLSSELARDNQESSKTRFTLLHSSRTPVDLPPPTILDPLVSYSASRPDRFRLRLFVDELDSSHRKYDLQVGRICKNVIEQSLGLCREAGFWRRIFRRPALETTKSLKDRKILFLVCGPPE
jgi:cytochrome-b5 reductase